MSYGGLPLDGIVAGHRARARLLSRLSPRQRQVAELVAGGLSDPEIAGRLLISRRTARAHVADVLRHLEATSRVEIACAVVLAQVLGSIG
ncbi:LuxR C-terminal-related transcriptional regulator [Streptomyces sp. NPDC001843]|uniref:LuxR C-terminal-related transcriptional regulator n=1 Tax=Streptomyces sp. NPDC001843 TaxID=3364617 RepID=UPI003683B36F